MSFVFFDTETTGLSKAFDQIVHFAAIRTDYNLNEIDRFEVRSRLCAHVIPHPSALRINRIGIAELLDPSLPSHYGMVRAIRQKLLSWSPSIFAGYNSIRFDEEMLRQAFFKTLHPLYLTSLHNNGRADVLNLVLSAAAASGEAISVPILDGRRSFKLPLLAAANGVHHAKAHDAMSDVLATIDLCRIVAARAPAAWQRFVRFSKKATVLDFIQGESAFLLTEFYANQAYETPVVCIGSDPSDANARLCLTLNLQTRELLRLADAELLAALASRPCPVRRLKVNTAPSLTPLYEVENVAFEQGLDEIEALALDVQSDTVGCARLVRAYQAMARAWPTSTHVEERIYERFFPREDELLMQQFHEVPWSERVALIAQMQDDRLRTLGLRLLYDEARHVLPVSVQQSIQHELSERIRADVLEPLGCAKAISEIDAIGDQSRESGVRLGEYRRYLSERLSKLA